MFNWFLQGLRAIIKDIEEVIIFSTTNKNDMNIPIEPVETPTPDVVPIVPQPEILLWDTPKHAWHATRVLCDNAGLTVAEKNIICACIYQESRFLNTAVNHNKNAQGKVTSTDWGIVQCNDWYHVGKGKEFPSVQYITDNPDKMVQWMIDCYKRGTLKMWVSYSSGAYHYWLMSNSPMWALAK